MSNAPQEKLGFKQRIAREFAEFAVNFLYLAFFFSMFTWYRRLILAEHHISYFHYGISIIEALILAKLIMIGKVLRLDRGFETKPLMVPVIYRTIVFSLFILAFKVVEQMVRGLWQGKGWGGSWDMLMHDNIYSVLAGCLVMFVAFIPFFAVKELSLIVGEGALYKLFFKKRALGAPIDFAK